ncbi:MAG: glycosyltransferase [Armatimonadota bacterium]|nr:glycosyltransferase [Armatimonadota bacterium]MDR7427555.1 glycosyltransferase [Armatimonadota bacterium]MDR7463435.1 glycosyltransferase [Armatimonadota bacterium]MDR7469719.1 glycosyltransferase [Armatimonadota bacterium]MDR7473948.1 glycosyltransferase [Armatimonadota bacterium]
MIPARIDVVMAVRNGGRYLQEAVDSMLGQSYPHIQLIVVDDGSTDATPQILAEAAARDPRVKVIRRLQSGLSRSLNAGIQSGQAPYVARMDADDISLPDRLAVQVAFLERNPDVALLGTACYDLDYSGRIRSRLEMPQTDAAIRRALIRYNPFFHSTVMMRRAALERVGLYREDLTGAEDYDLWFRFALYYRLANLSYPLVCRRSEREGSVSVTREQRQIWEAIGIRWQAVRRGMYPFWASVFLVRPALMLLMPAWLRRALRLRARASGLVVRR